MAAFLEHTIRLLIIFCLLSAFAQGACPASTSLDMFHKDNVLVDNRYQYKLGDVTKFGYIYNYPLKMLAEAGTGNINTIFALNSFDWQCDLQLNFLFRRFESPTAVLIGLQTSKMSWKQLPLTIFINNRRVRENLYFGEGIFDIPQQTSSKYTAQVDIPFTSSQTKAMTFITGISAKFKNSSNFFCDVNIKEEAVGNKKLKISVNIGSNLLVSKISVVYVAYNPKGQDFYAYTNTISFVSKKAGTVTAAFPEDIVATENLIVGIRGIKQIIGSTELVTFATATQLLLSVKLGQFVDQLTVGYIGIHAQPTKFCEKCPGSPYILSIGEQTTCEASCTNSYIHTYLDGSKACMNCSAELNLSYKDGKCQCSNSQYINPTNQKRGKCVTIQQSFALFSTASISDKDCSDPNAQIGFSGACQCKSSYQKNTTLDKCVRRCPLGIWNGYACDQCLAGTYPWDAQLICKPCGDNCAQCATENTCKTCKQGFYANTIKQCIEICGDGKKFTLKCDDGNRNNNDGCDQNCETELGYVCSGGSATKGDTCYLSAVTLTMNTYSLTTSMLIMSYTVSPPPNKQFTTGELQNIFDVRTSLLDGGYPYLLFISQDASSLGSFRLVFDFMGTLPVVQQAQVTVRYLISNPVASSTSAPEFLSAGLRGFNSGRDYEKLT